MKGTNTLTLNIASVETAVQHWLSTVVMTSKVKVTNIQWDASLNSFVVSISEVLPEGYKP